MDPALRELARELAHAVTLEVTGAVSSVVTAHVGNLTQTRKDLDATRAANLDMQRELAETREQVVRLSGSAKKGAAFEESLEEQLKALSARVGAELHKTAHVPHSGDFQVVLPGSRVKVLVDAKNYKRACACTEQVEKAIRDARKTGCGSVLIVFSRLDRGLTFPIKDSVHNLSRKGFDAPMRSSSVACCDVAHLAEGLLAVCVDAAEHAVASDSREGSRVSDAVEGAAAACLGFAQTLGVLDGLARGVDLVSHAKTLLVKQLREAHVAAVDSGADGSLATTMGESASAAQRKRLGKRAALPHGGDGVGVKQE